MTRFELILVVLVAVGCARSRTERHPVTYPQSASVSATSSSVAMPSTDTNPTTMNDMTPANESFARPPISQTRHDLTTDDFKNLPSVMTPDHLFAKVGKPRGDSGSGIHIFLYALADGTTVIVGNDGRHTVYVNHVGLNGRLINELFKNPPAQDGRSG